MHISLTGANLLSQLDVTLPLVTRIAVKENRHAVLDAVQARVEAYSKRVHIASIALNLLIRELFQSVPDELLHFTKYLKTVLEQYDTLWNEYLKPRWANQRMRLYGGKKRVFAKFFNGLVSKGKKTVVAYGAAKFARFSLS